MTLPQDEVIRGLIEENTRFEELLRSLGAADLEAPTRCDGWTVRDVAAHVVGGLADITAGNFDGIGTQEFVDRQVRERKGRSAHELADELVGATKVGQEIIGALDENAWAGPAPGGLDFPMGEGVEAVWYDTYVHGEDIRAALGRPATRGPGVKASVSHLADLLGRAGWGPATLALEGLPEVPVGDGGGRRVEGDPLQFVLVGTGRADPASMGLDETANVYR